MLLFPRKYKWPGQEIEFGCSDILVAKSALALIYQAEVCFFLSAYSVACRIAYEGPYRVAQARQSVSFHIFMNSDGRMVKISKFLKQGIY